MRENLCLKLFLCVIWSYFRFSCLHGFRSVCTYVLRTYVCDRRSMDPCIRHWTVATLTERVVFSFQSNENKHELERLQFFFIYFFPFFFLIFFDDDNRHRHRRLSFWMSPLKPAKVCASHEWDTFFRYIKSILILTIPLAIHFALIKGFNYCALNQFVYS